MAEHRLMEEWLTDEFMYREPVRGEIRRGIVVALEPRGALLDVGLKRSGFVPREDIERLEEESSMQIVPGAEVTARVVEPITDEDLILMSVYEALSEKDWDRADEMLASEETWRGKVTGYNRGGLLLKFHHLEAFLPASHLWDRSKRYLSGPERKEMLQSMIGQELVVKFIEVERDDNRLIASERLAREQRREEAMRRLLNELREGQVVEGTVSGLAKFGAFVDLGGADGLIHISELSWEQVNHPREVVKVGDKVKVYVLNLDRENERISLSLKRLEPSPWMKAEEALSEGQLVSGVVTNVVDFGAFVALDDFQIEGLVHVSELSDPPPADPHDLVREGDRLVLRVLSIDPVRQRIALSWKSVAEWEHEEYLAHLAEREAREAEEAKQEAEAEARVEAGAEPEAEVDAESEDKTDESGRTESGTETEEA
jgi:small subunit ribosomal protein S1